jgi:hypothetical protein
MAVIQRGLCGHASIVIRRPTSGQSVVNLPMPGVGIGQEPPLAAGIAAPDVQRCLGNPTWFIDGLHLELS